MSHLNAFTFVPEARRFETGDALVVRIVGNICTTQQLLDQLYRLLQLPGYFGFNWNALFDCLRDFHWVVEKEVIIVHEEIPELPQPEMRTYLEVLRDAVADWKPGDAHSLQVVFYEKDRAHIEKVMEQSK